MAMPESSVTRGGSRVVGDLPTVPSEMPPLDVTGLSGSPDESAEYSSPDSGEVEDILGFSIGPQQSRMRSPDTSAYEKTRALEQSKGYFDTHIECRLEKAQQPESDYEGDAVQTTGDQTDGAAKFSEVERAQKPASKSENLPASSPALSGSARQEGHLSHSSRPPVEPTRVIDALKKLLPDLPSIPTLVPSISRLSLQRLRDERRSKRSQTLTSRPNPDWLPTATTAEYETLKARTQGNDDQLSHSRESTPSGANSSGYNSTSGKQQSQRPKLRRAASETSLFIKQDLARAETLDGAEKWADVSDILNARFKAITDSWQDSAMARMPRIPRMPDLGISKLLPQPRSPITAGNFNTPGKVQPHRKITTSKASFDPHPMLNEAVSCLKGDVVILGGYRGSILRSAKPPHKQLWVPVKVGMNLRRVNLEIGLRDEDEENVTESIIPSGVLSHIGPIDICRRLMKYMKKSPSGQAGTLRVHDFGYDWRLSPHLLSQQLIRFLETLHCNRINESKDSKGAVVIAHSLGGLITRHAVNQRPDLFSGVVYAGTPTKAVNILGPLRNGDEVLLSSRVLTAQVNFTIRSSFALLPEDGRCFINKMTGEQYDIDFFDAKTWEEYCLSPCVGTDYKPFQADQRKSIVGVLSESLPSLPFTGKRNSVRLSPKSPRETRDKIPDSVGGAFHDVKSNIINAQVGSLEPSMDQFSAGTHCNNTNKTTTIPHAEAMVYLERTLTSVRRFKDQTAFRSNYQHDNLYPPIAVLYGDTVPTVFGARVDSREAIKRSDCFDNLAFAVGDGIILAKAARPPEGYKVVKDGLVRSDRGHIGLLGDLEAVGKCLKAIISARSKGVGLGLSEAR